jgi:hypothetical protein
LILGVATNPGWCPQPSNLGAPVGSYSGATGAAPLVKPPPPAPIPWQFDPQNPENMTRSERLRLVGREMAAGRLQTKQELDNFLATGNPGKTWTPPPQKPLVKPSNMTDEQWQKFQVAHPRSPPPDYVRGTPITPLLVPGEIPHTMEENAKAKGGTLTDLPGAVAIPAPAPAKTTTPAPSQPPTYPSAGARAVDEMAKMDAEAKKHQRYKPVTKLGVHRTQAQPVVRSSSITAIDRLGSGHGATGGSRTTRRTGSAALEKAKSPAPAMSALDRLSGVSSAPAGNKNNTRSAKGTGHLNAPQMVPHNYVTLPAQRSQDTFRQPK